MKIILSYFLKFFSLLKKNKKRIFEIAFRLIAIGFVFFIGLIVYYSLSLPDPNRLLDRNLPESTKIYSRDGVLLYEIFGEYKRTRVSMDDISIHLKNATIAIEDKDFYTHGGISFRGIARAIYIDIVNLDKSQGASTITQQFVKNALLSNEKSISRKLKEIILSIMIDARYSKEQILLFYLNEIPYGRNAYGVESAAKTYFGKSAKEVTLAESAYIAGITNRPSYLNPSGPNRKALDSRKDLVLSRMLEQGYIKQEDYEQAKKEKVEFKTANTALNAGHFVFYAQDVLAEKIGERTLQEGGFKVTTTIDSRLQKIAEDAISAQADSNVKNSNAHNAALVAFDPKTGQILAMVGGKDYFGKSFPEGCTSGVNCLFEPNVNVALADRQPGSSFKPYAYVTGFKKEHGYAPASVLMDVTTNFGSNGGKDYIPQNYDFLNRGPVSIRQSLAGSLNIPAVKMASLVGVDNIVETARSLGINAPFKDCGLAIALGGCEVKLLDHAHAYATLGALGTRHDKSSLLEVKDKDGKKIFEYEDKSEDVLDPQSAYMLMSIMKDNDARAYIFGVNSPINFGGRDISCKTGTTQNWRDGWAMCTSPTLAVGVWTGNNDGTYMKKGADAIRTAGPIVRKFMNESLKVVGEEKFEAPQGIQNITIEKMSGKLPTGLSADTRSEVFASFAVPKDRDNVHYAVKINKETGQAADSTTPEDKVMVKVYTILHSERKGNASWEQPVVKWAIDNGYEYPPQGSVFISDYTQSGSGTVDIPDVSSQVKPEVAITYPIDGEVITSMPFGIKVDLLTNFSVSKIDISIDGQHVATKSQAPFEFIIDKNLSPGEHAIVVRAMDKFGQEGVVLSNFYYRPDAFSETQNNTQNLLQNNP